MCVKCDDVMEKSYSMNDVIDDSLGVILLQNGMKGLFPKEYGVQLYNKILSQECTIKKSVIPSSAIEDVMLVPVEMPNPQFDIGSQMFCLGYYVQLDVKGTYIQGDPKQ